MVLVNILIFAILAISLFLNFALIYRFVQYDAEFVWDISDPDDVKPLLKIDFDKVEDMNFFVVKVKKIKNDESRKK